MSKSEQTNHFALPGETRAACRSTDAKPEDTYGSRWEALELVDCVTCRGILIRVDPVVQRWLQEGKRETKPSLRCLTPPLRTSK